MTPTEELISEVLIARARLGHTTWTFMATPPRTWTGG